MTSRRQFIKTAAWGMAAQACRNRPASRAADRPRSDAAAEPGPDAAVPRAEVRDLGLQFADNPVGITGQDGATSIVLSRRKTLWTFGDTLDFPFASIRQHDLKDVLSNTAAVVPIQDASDGIKQFQYLTAPGGKQPRPLISFLPGEDPARIRLWPVHGVATGSDVYVFYHKISMIPHRDVFDTFNLEGMGIARAALDTLEFERLVAPDKTREFWKSDAPGFGVFTTTHDDGFVYLWGCLLTGMYLARTKPDTIDDLTSYQYLVQAPTAGNPAQVPRWGRNFQPAAPLFDGVPNEMSAAYNPYLKRYLAVHTLFRENKLVMRTAPRISGPWSPPSVFHSPTKIKQDDLFYAAKEHPELARDDGRIVYITYVNSSVYLPHLLEVTFA